MEWAMSNKLPVVLARILKERKWSQRKLSKESGVSLSSINGMMTGKESYSTANLIAVSDALSVSIDRLLRDLEPSQRFNVDSIPATEVLDGVYRLVLTRLDIPKGEK